MERDVSAAPILVVDDDAAIRNVLQEILVDEGYHVVTAANGAEALRYLQSNRRPRLILLDLMMPVMDGAEFHARKNADPRLRDIPVIVLSAHLRARELIADDVATVLPKPVRYDQLVQAVDSYC